MKKRDLEELTITNINQNGQYVTAETETLLKINLAAIYDKTNIKFISLEIDDISDYNCPYCPY